MFFDAMGSLGIRISLDYSQDLAFTDIPESSIRLSAGKLHVLQGSALTS